MTHRRHRGGSRKGFTATKKSVVGCKAWVDIKEIQRTNNLAITKFEAQFNTTLGSVSDSVSSTGWDSASTTSSELIATTTTTLDDPVPKFRYFQPHPPRLRSLTASQIPARLASSASTWKMSSTCNLWSLQIAQATRTASEACSIALRICSQPVSVLRMNLSSLW